MKTIAVLGAHGAVAKALVECIEERELPVELLRATTTEHIEPELTLIDESVLSADLFIACDDSPVIRALLQRVEQPVLDLARAVPEAPLAYFGLEDRVVEGSLRIPVGLAVPMVSALLPLSPFGPTRVSAAALQSAAVQGQPGMDELSDQVRALFSMREAEPSLFRATLAFDVIPEDGAGLEAEVAEGLERQGRAMDVRIAQVTVPTFSAESALVDVVVEDAAPDLGTVIDALRGAKGVHYAGDELVAVDALGRDDALVGRAQVGPNRIGFFLAVDRLRRGSATLACLAVERWLG